MRKDLARQADGVCLPCYQRHMKIVGTSCLGDDSNCFDLSEDALPLPLAGGGFGVRVPSLVVLPVWREFPPPASHLSMPCDLPRKRSQAGGVKRVCGETAR